MEIEERTKVITEEDQVHPVESDNFAIGVIITLKLSIDSSQTANLVDTSLQ